MDSIQTKKQNISKIKAFTRRIAALFYDLLLITSILFFASFIFIYLFKDTPLFIYRAYLLIIILNFYYYFLSKSGQTLGMLAWKLKLQDSKHHKLTNKHYIKPRQFLIRCALATLTNIFFFTGYLWLFIDKDNQCLFDRLSKTKIIYL